MNSYYLYNMLKRIIILSMLCIMAGCATTQTTDNYAKDDSLEPANRVFFNVNETIDQALIKPIAVPLTGAFKGTPASKNERVLPHTDPIEVDPLELKTSLTTLST